MGLLLQVAHGTPRPVLWDPSGTLPLSPAGWREIVDGIETAVSALAIVLPDEEVPLLGPFPEVIASMLIPVRIFADPVEARDWLLGFVD
jgi:hypothetical protein